MKGWINLKKYNHIKLNNEVMQRKNGGMGFFNLEKDKEALDEYMREVNDYTIHFDSEMERLHYLIENNFYYNVFKQYAESIVQ